MFTYEEAVAYIENIPKFTTKNKLEHTRKCLDLLGSPDKDRKIIHVAGNQRKGKRLCFSVLHAGTGRISLRPFYLPSSGENQ